MTTVPIFFQAMAVGFVIAAPIGPMGVLCIKRTLTNGFWCGLATGLGAASGGAVYGILVAFSITSITAFLTSKMLSIKLIGGGLLAILGVRELYSHKNLVVGGSEHLSFAKALGSAFLVALTNPIGLISFLSIIPALVESLCCTPMQAVILVSGIFTGSITWWLILSTIISRTKRHLSVNQLQIIRVLSGIVLICFGLFISFKALVS
jgi:threonine/homoserine/homoserine lactone efflux protein